MPATERDWFSVLSDGLVVAVEPEPGGVVDERGRVAPRRGRGAVTAFTGKVDVGQGNRTALSLLVAAELGVPVDSVRLVMGDTDLCPYDAARSAVAPCRTPDRCCERRPLPRGVRSTRDHSSRASAGSRSLRPKRPARDRQRAPRDAADSRSFSARPSSQRPDATGRPKRVGADAQGSPGAGPDEDELEAHLRSHPAGEPSIQELGDVERALADAAVRLDATYTTAYIAHVPLETRAALAEWDGEG